jgi:CubicO group peptidase (beta-lactamase class C family)
MRIDIACVTGVAMAVGLACGASPATMASDGPASADASAYADAAPGWGERLTDLASPLVDPNGGPDTAVGLVVGVSAPSVHVIVGLGATSVGGSTRPTGDSIFEIGSVTKVFTGLLFAQALARGELDLEDPIDPFFPAGVPHFEGRSIRLLDLATHTSGLPWMPTNLHAPPPNPGAGYSLADLEAFLMTYPLPADPGSRFQYSNVGTSVLGQVVRMRAGATDFASLLRRDVTGPIGLIDTTITLTAEQEGRRVQGHDAGAPMPPNEIGPGMAAGGALRSTGEDLLLLLAKAQEEAVADGPTAWKLALEPRRPSPYGQNGRTGLLINVQDHAGYTVYSKNGETAGFSAEIAFTTAPPRAVVLLANSHDVRGLNDLALAILDELLMIP